MFKFTGSRLYWRARSTCQRWRRALAYGAGRLGAEDALAVLLEVQRPAGCYVLVTMDEDTTLEEMLEQYEDHPRLREFVADGCEQVAYKWDDAGDTAYHAREWAIDKAVEYAGQEGVHFNKLEN